MTRELYFQKKILPYLEDVINWKKILFLEVETVSELSDIGLIKEREEADRDIDSFIVCEEYSVRFHRYLKFISKIQKGNKVVYEYSDGRASKEKPGMVYI